MYWLYWLCWASGDCNDCKDCWDCRACRDCKDCWLYWLKIWKKSHLPSTWKQEMLAHLKIVETVETVRLLRLYRPKIWKIMSHSLTYLFTDNLKARDASASKNDLKQYHIEKTPKSAFAPSKSLKYDMIVISMTFCILSSSAGKDWFYHCQSFPIHREGQIDDEKMSVLQKKTREILGNPFPPHSRFPWTPGRWGWIPQYLPRFVGARTQSHVCMFV